MKGRPGGTRGSPAAGQVPAGVHESPSSTTPLQSLSAPSQTSGDGPSPPVQSLHMPNSPVPRHVW